MRKFYGPTPFLKWAGGKRSLLSTILPLFPPHFLGYHEPFLGGGALAFALRGSGCSVPMDLSDANERLITTYIAVQHDVEAVIVELRRLAARHSVESYKRARKQLSSETDPVRLAALFIYLNKTGFNGLYRVNRAGDFNVPLGANDKSKVLDVEKMRAASVALHGVQLTSRDFHEISILAKHVYYFDPPYDGTYANYQASGFTDVDQERLALLCGKIDAAGGYVIASNSDTPLIRELYEGFHVQVVQGSRSISRNGAGRGRRPELLILGSMLAELNFTDASKRHRQKTPQDEVLAG
ncbi:MAG: DNA adenine methylase [Acidimicrobiales bacterium]